MEVLELIESTIDDIVNDNGNMDDTMWCTGTETMLDRMVDIYKKSGGDIFALSVKYPQYGWV